MSIYCLAFEYCFLHGLLQELASIDIVAVTILGAGRILVIIYSQPSEFITLTGSREAHCLSCTETSHLR